MSPFACKECIYLCLEGIFHFDFRVSIKCQGREFLKHVKYSRSEKVIKKKKHLFSRLSFSRLKYYYYCSQKVQDKTGDFAGVYVLGCFIFQRSFSEPTVFKNQEEDLHIKSY